MSTSRLESLPPELLTIVVEYIPRPTDLKSLCLTCKVLRDIATPPLYKTAVFDQSTPRWPESSFGCGFLSLENSGLAHVRVLEVAPSPWTTCNDLEQDFVKRALQVLPRHGLRAIIMAEIPCSEDMLSLLCTQQSKLTKISLGPIMFDFGASLRSSAFGSNLWNGHQEIIIPEDLGSLKDLHAYHHLIRRSSSLSALNIGVYSCLSGENLLASDAHSEGTISKILFSQTGGVSEPARLGLRRLSLANTRRSELEIYTLRSIDVSTLTSLTIYTMIRNDPSLELLAAHFEKYGSSLVELSYKNLWQSEALLERLLNSFGGLNKLVLQGSSPDLQSLKKHRASLEVLSLDAPISGAGVDDGGIHKHIAAHFPSLKVLSIDMPGIELSAHGGASYTIWLDSLEVLVTMPRIQVVKMRHMPFAPVDLFSDHPDNERLNVSAYMEIFTRWTDDHLGKIYTQAAQVKEHLPMLTFGDPGGPYIKDADEKEFDIERFVLSPAKRIDAFGRVSQVLVKGTVLDACYMEPELREVLQD